MAEKLETVYDPDGNKHEHTSLNAHDLVAHSGYTRNKLAKVAEVDDEADDAYAVADANAAKKNVKAAADIVAKNAKGANARYVDADANALAAAKARAKVKVDGDEDVNPFIDAAEDADADAEADADESYKPNNNANDAGYENFERDPMGETVEKKPGVDGAEVDILEHGDRFDNMTKDELDDYAKKTFAVQLDGRKSRKTLLSEVRGLEKSLKPNS